MKILLFLLSTAFAQTAYQDCINVIPAPQGADTKCTYYGINGNVHRDKNSKSMLRIIPKADFQLVTQKRIREDILPVDTLPFTVVPVPEPVYQLRRKQVDGTYDTLNFSEGAVTLTGSGHSLLLTVDSSFAAQCPLDSKCYFGEIRLMKKQQYADPKLVASISAGATSIELGYLLNGRPSAEYLLSISSFQRENYNEERVEVELAQPLQQLIQYQAP